MEKELIVITGPSGAGKTTLLNELKKKYSIGIPKQVTTREPRKDDNPDLYRYISIEEFEKMQQEGRFALYSGRHERRYGILKCDIMECLDKEDLIAIITSYKDIPKIKKMNISSKIIVLTFRDIEKTTRERIINSGRFNDKRDIIQRTKYALMEHEKYFSYIEKEADIIVYTDISDINQTTELVHESLQIKIKEDEMEIG